MGYLEEMEMGKWIYMSHFIEYVYEILNNKEKLFKNVKRGKT